MRKIVLKMILWTLVGLATSCGGSYHGQPSVPTPAPPAHLEWLSPLPAGTQLNAIQLHESGTGIAVGELGTIVFTRDGGSSWSVAESGTQ